MPKKTKKRKARVLKRITGMVNYLVFRETPKTKKPRIHGKSKSLTRAMRQLPKGKTGYILKIEKGWERIVKPKAKQKSQKKRKRRKRKK